MLNLSMLGENQLVCDWMCDNGLQKLIRLYSSFERLYCL